MLDQTAVTPTTAPTKLPARLDRKFRLMTVLNGVSVVPLVLWSIIPTLMTLWFSFQRYNLVNVTNRDFIGAGNYVYLLGSPTLVIAVLNTVFLVAGVLIITIVGGVLLAVLFNSEFYGRSIARVLAISPFFVMPTVAALIWKNMLMHPVNGMFASIARSLGLPAFDWLGSAPLLSIIIIVAWQWIGFSLLILLTALQSLNTELVEAARLDGAGGWQLLRHIYLPHLSRPIAIVVMIEAIFLLSVFAEIFVTTNGGPGLASTNLAFLVYIQALLRFDVGLASAGGVIAIILANLVAFFLVRSVARTLDI